MTYESVLGKWNAACPPHTLLYVGAGWDMKFPLHRVNVLIDALPATPHYARGMWGYPLGEHLKETIHWQLQAIFPEDLAFEEDMKRERWCWSSKLRDVQIIYYYNMRFKRNEKMALPDEALKADILYAKGHHPIGIERLLPALRFFELGPKTADWSPSDVPMCETDPAKQPLAKLPQTTKRSEFLDEMCDLLRQLWQMQIDLS